MEREVDIRRRVSAMCVNHPHAYDASANAGSTISFNRRESEFTSLLAYNNYLEEVENLTFNLVTGTDVPATEAKLAAYAAKNAPTIARNAALSSQEHLSTEARQAAEKEEVKLRREAARKEEIDEKRGQAEGRREMVERLKEGKGEPDDIMREGQKVVLKKSTARRSAAEKARLQQLQKAQVEDIYGTGNGSGGSDPSFFIQGLKPVEAVEPEKPYDPFGGLEQKMEYFVLQDHYEHAWLDKARTDPVITAGGYDVKEYYARTMVEAFSGLGCFIADEVTARDTSKNVATAAAAMAGGDGEVKDDDVL